MDAQWIESYYVRQHDTCCEHLRRYARRASNDDLHMVRVAIKKIRAILLMAHRLHGLDAETHFMPYALAFHQAGPVREASLIRDHLAAISTDKHALALRTRAISTLHQSLKRSIPTRLRGIEGELDATLFVLRDQDYDVESYCTGLRKKIRKKWRKAGPDTDYHSIRRQIKHYIYALSLLPPAQQRRLISKRDLAKLDKLQEQMGRWHDYIDMSCMIFSDLADREAVDQQLRKEIPRIRRKFIKKGNSLWG